VYSALKLPGVAVPHPVVRLLDLAAILQDLTEHAVLVAQAVALHGELEGGAGVQKARGKAAETAVAQACIRFVGRQLLELDPKIEEPPLGLVTQPEVEHGVA
jgi:hypothetical protein